MILYDLKKENSEVLYLIKSGGTSGADDTWESVQASIICKTKFEKIGAFITPKKSYNKIDIAYDSRFICDHIHLNRDKTKFYIPVVKDYKCTGKHLVYVFDGNNFVYDKNAK